MNHYTKLTTQQCKQISGGVAGGGVKGGVPYDDTNNTTL
ncbi:hypothetical protein PPIS_b0303 [Pseudoalteromonas piscicida]|uniref:Bacteriocin n=2 Tax=Pseudoalteromonas TaxID=53246 RepID=A0ABM6NKS5_PSEO7|nr:hypothetical protein PPIS_b0303 [Pseudoalteromonas piscicida]